MGAGLNILIVHNYYRLPGGEDVVVDNESRLLREAGHKVILYTRHNSETDEMPAYKKLLLPFSFIYSNKTYRDIKRLIAEESIDVVMVHNTLMLVSPSVYYAALRSQVPVIQVIHNFRLLCPGAALYRDGHVCEDCIERGLMCSLRHKCYRNSFVSTLACVLSLKYHRWRGIYGKLYYICLTDFNRDKLLTLSQIKKERCFVKPNFTQYKGEGLPWDLRKGFIYAGRLDELKGVKEILKAWELMGSDGPELTVCGDGPLKEWCLDHIRQKGLTNVSYKGRLLHDELMELIGRAKALLAPSLWYEGLPMTIIEAYSVGTPVIGSNIGNVAAVIEPERLGLRIDMSRGEKAIEEAVLRFLRPGGFCYDKAAFEEAAFKYGKEENLRQLEEILKKWSV